MRLLQFVHTALLALAVAAPLAAQEAELHPGQRVRLVAPTALGAPLVGTILERRADTLVVAPPGGTSRRLLIGELTEARVSLGPSRRRGAAKGALIGAAIGGGLSTLFILPALGREEANIEGRDAALFVYQMSAGSTLWGAGIGALLRAERWRSLSLVPAATAGGGRALRVGVAHRF